MDWAEGFLQAIIITRECVEKVIRVENAAASFYFLSWPAELIPACVTAIAVLARKGSDANLDAAHG